MTPILPVLLLLQVAPAPRPPAPAPAQGAAVRADTARPAPAMTLPAVEEKPIVTHHTIQAGGRALAYSVTTGMMPLKDEKGTVEANVFFMAYTLDNPPAGSKRPLMFSFNGGPGSASVWLHMGALGPRRVKMEDDGWLPAAPYQLVDNDQTWLATTDLVFIDPVGTGFSRAATPELGRKFWGLRGDIESVGTFIRLYLSRYERWTSPLFVVGESYGTTRAAGLSDWLVNHGIALNGVVLVSTILNFETADWSTANDLPYALLIPTYTATAWYHKKLSADLQQVGVEKAVDEARHWVMGDYLLALAKGDQLTPEEYRQEADRLAHYTGLDPKYTAQSNLRVDLGRFQKELLREQGRTVGRLDTRFRGFDATQGGDRPEFDPSMAAIRPPYTALFNDYVRRELGYKSDLEYYILGGGIGARWDFGSDNEYVDVGESLRSAFAKNPHMRLYVAFGYYDAATPLFAAEYTLNHLRLDPSLRDHITRGYFEAGHMMYIHLPSLAKLSKEVAGFVQKASEGK
jgi:carboxypeptidase C (cathepsin A)